MALGGRDQARQGAKQGGLAAGIGADDRGDPAGGNGEIEPLQHEGIVIAERK